MGEQPNPFEVVENVNRALYGDPVNRTPGLIEKVDTLLAGMSKLSADVDQLKRRRTSATSYLIGYAIFCVAILFAIIAVVKLAGDSLASVSPELAGGIAIVLAIVALVFLLNGHGWIQGE